MSLYGNALSTIRSIVLIEDRFKCVTDKVDSLTEEMRGVSDRLTRLETIIEITRPDGATLRIAGKPTRQSRNKTPETP